MIVAIPLVTVMFSTTGSRWPIFGPIERLLNGPRLPGETGHSTQDEIDALFGRA